LFTQGRTLVVDIQVFARATAPNDCTAALIDENALDGEILNQRRKQPLRGSGAGAGGGDRGPDQCS
jgi:hypothetical protein